MSQSNGDMEIDEEEETHDTEELLLGGAKKLVVVCLSFLVSPRLHYPRGDKLGAGGAHMLTLSDLKVL